jgi:hypothetical protein
MLVLMQRALAVMSLLAACGGGQGVDLEVTSEVAIDRVELFFATDHCYKEDGTLCDSLAWETAMPRVPGEVYVMKGDENIVATSEFKGERAVMHLEATPEFRDPKYLAIIGFKGDTAVAYALMVQPHIPANTAETWRLQLRSALPGTHDVTVPPAAGERYERVQAWKRERVENANELSRCLALQFWEEDKHEWGGLFIVPASDPDCDGRLIECDPLHANFNVGGGAVGCVTTVASLPNTPCVVGSSLCADGASRTGACNPTTLDGLLCVPQEICNVCGDDAGLEACAMTSIKGNDAVSGVACSFSGTDNGTSCGPGFDGSWSRIHLPVQCSAVEVRSIAAPFSSSGPQTVAPVGSASISVFTDSSSGTGCMIDLKWSSGTAIAGDSATFVFMVKGAGTTNTLALPVRILFTQNYASCSVTATEPRPCEANPALETDSMLRCLQPPP